MLLTKSLYAVLSSFLRPQRKDDGLTTLGVVLIVLILILAFGLGFGVSKFFLLILLLIALVFLL